MMPLHSDRFGLAYDSSLFRPVFHYLLPVGHPTTSLLITLIHRSEVPPPLPLWFAPQELLLGAMVRHPLHVA